MITSGKMENKTGNVDGDETARFSNSNDDAIGEDLTDSGGLVDMAPLRTSV